MFGKTAETAGQYLNKGKQIYIEGRLHYDSYVDKDNVKRYTTDIIANQMRMLGGRGEEGGGRQDGGAPQYSNRQPPQGGSTHQPEQPPPDEDEDDLPF